MQKISIQFQDRGHTGVSPLVRLRAQFARRAVKGIAHHRMPEGRNGDANLGRASGLAFQFNQRKLPVGRIDLSLYRIMRHGLASAETLRRHARAPLRVAADGALNRAPILLRAAVYQRNIRLVDFASTELLRQSPMRFVVLCDYHQPAGRTIQTMYDPWTQVAAHRGKRPKVM